MIYAQPNSWQCGPFALKHALLMYGRPVHEEDLTRLAGTSETCGTDEHGLAAALEPFGGTLKVIRRRTRERARHELIRWLDRGIPVLLCVDQWDHWITAAGDLGDRVALFDSHFDNAVFRTEPWDRLLDRIVFRRSRLRGMWTTRWWDLHPVLLPAAAAVRRLGPDHLLAVFGEHDPDRAVTEALLADQPPRAQGPSPRPPAPAPAVQHHLTRTV